ncbi:MAG TPA: carboxymuconolactone decarboxylase family protein [Gemmatimonadales bacterium]|nr:carboxymuconolactone decarboxylase family protein [Gemmatimonadales bacterium]
MSDTPALDAATAALIGLAAAIAHGDEQSLAGQVESVREAETPAEWVDELLLQSVLMVGWPRALGGAAIWRALSGAPATPSAAEDIDYAGHPAWTTRGEALCATIYGGNYPKLRENVRTIHPALDAWMVTEGYGRTLARPGLDPRRRELCVVAQIAVINAPRQLLSHLIGALHVGATRADIDETLAIADGYMAEPVRAVAQQVWSAVRAARSAAP